MAGMEREKPGGSTALLGVHFDDRFGIDCRIFVPAGSLKEVLRSATALQTKRLALRF